MRKQRPTGPGLFGEPERPAPPKKRPPTEKAKRKTQSRESSAESGVCLRALQDGDLCAEPQFNQAVYPVPCDAKSGSWAFVTPCERCAGDLLSFEVVMPEWHSVIPEDRRLMDRFLREEWPEVIRRRTEKDIASKA